MELEQKVEEVMRRSKSARETLQGLLTLFEDIRADDVSHILMICLGDIASAFMCDVARLSKITKSKIRGDTLVAIMINNLDGYAKHLIEQLESKDEQRH